MAVNMTYCNMKDFKIFVYTAPISTQKREKLIEYFAKKQTVYVSYDAMEIFKKLQKELKTNVESWKIMAVGDTTADLILNKSKENDNKLKLLKNNVNNILYSDNIERSLADYKVNKQIEK